MPGTLELRVGHSFQLWQDVPVSYSENGNQRSNVGKGHRSKSHGKGFRDSMTAKAVLALRCKPVAKEFRCLLLF